MIEIYRPFQPSTGLHISQRSDRRSELPEILSRAAAVVCVDEQELTNADQVFHVLIRRNVLRQEGPYVTVAVALMVLLRGTKPHYLYQQRETRDLRLIAPWVDKRWRWGNSVQADVLEARIQDMCDKLGVLLDRHFPHGKHLEWFQDEPTSPTAQADVMSR